MSKHYQIKWRESDYQELGRVVRNFNAKVSRLQKQNPQLKNVLPERVSEKALKELISTRQDLKRELNMLRRFSKRGAEEIVVIDDTDYNIRTTKWQRTEMKRVANIVSRKRKAKLDRIMETEMKSRGESLGYTRGELGMGRLREVALRPMNPFVRTMSQVDVNKRFSSMRKQSQSDYYTKQDYACRDNYLKGLLENYNWNDIKDVYNKIKSMAIEDFMTIFEEEDSTFEIASPDGSMFKYQEYLSYVEALKSTWMPSVKESAYTKVVKKEDGSFETIGESRYVTNAQRRAQRRKAERRTTLNQALKQKGPLTDNVVNSLTVADLRQIAKHRRIEGYSGLNRKELINLIQNSKK